MILTCPECATSYFVDDSRIPEAGRTVKCASCAHRWTAKRETGEFTSTDPEPAVAPAPVAPAAVADQPAAAAPLDADDLEIVAVEAEPSRRPPPRPAANPRGDTKGKVLTLAAAAVLVVALVAGAILFRSQVVRLWPKSQAAYAGLGMPENSVGLVIEGVHAEPTFLGGRPVLSITGAIRNVKEAAVNAPSIRVNLLDRAGKAISAKIVRPIDPRVPAGATRHFAIAITDPPANARDLEVVFETAGRQSATAPVAIGPAAPVEAQPLPAGSPESLAEHG
ncbi:DUF3426 domain-containing protein [Phenylobacterium sp.]|uniref:DUF3426 domain-containing protein n=1 Tax=Phenylobacterium sp. TaxID=1871053 RepID=UPI002DECCA5F|nr:DUF3426 domain-containing protein [Phenylobacterium sp.]